MAFEITRCDQLAVEGEGTLRGGTLEVPDCTRPCVVLEDQVCLLGSHGNHFFTFFAHTEAGEPVGNLHRRRVAGYSRDLGGCRPADIVCREG